MGIGYALCPSTMQGGDVSGIVETVSYTHLDVYKRQYQDFLNNETRYSRLTRSFPERAQKLFAASEEAAKARYEHLQRLVELYK